MGFPFIKKYVCKNVWLKIVCAWIVLESLWMENKEGGDLEFTKQPKEFFCHVRSPMSLPYVLAGGPIVWHPGYPQILWSYRI